MMRKNKLLIKNVASRREKRHSPTSELAGGSDKH
jgi:hypothetical protein